MTQVAQPIRSPSYPSMSLGDAVEAVGKIHLNYRMSNVDRIAAAKLMGYSSLSGPANKALAALAQYGLVERAGKGEMRVTPRAAAILHPDAETERSECLRLAAFEPKLFQDLQTRYPDMVPPEDGIVTYLNRQGFNQTAIGPAVKAYLQTLHFLRESGVTKSGRDEPPTNLKVGDVEDAPEQPVFGGARVGDLIQWEVDGVLQLEQPLRVRLVQDDEQWIAVEGSETGIPMGEVIVQERAVAPPVEAPRFPLKPLMPAREEFAPATDGWKEERLIDDGGEEIFIRYRGEPTAERYTYIRDYLDFKLKRMTKADAKRSPMLD